MFWKLQCDIEICKKALYPWSSSTNVFVYYLVMSQKYSDIVPEKKVKFHQHIITLKLKYVGVISTVSLKF
jgi:hypothetical protein